MDVLNRVQNFQLFYKQSYVYFPLWVTIII